MEIDITDFFNGVDTWPLSGSVATHGPNAGSNTWENAKGQARDAPLLTTPEQIQALKDHVQAMGFGEDVQAFDDEACNALFIQLVSGDMREAGLDDCEPEDVDWTEYQQRSQDGEISGNIFRCDIEGHEAFGRIFYYLGE